MHRLIVAACLLLAACTGSVAQHDLAGSPVDANVAPQARTTPVDWPMYHLNAGRTANYPSMPAFTNASVTKTLSLDGKVYASPLVVAGTIIVATENDTVYAFDATTYAQKWTAHLGTPSPAAQRPCGNIDPLGITGTPVYSKATGDIYVAPEFSGSPPTHELYALKLGTGAVAFHTSLDLPGVDQVAMQERSALALVGQRVYVPFGGLAGDCGNYKGRVVGFAADGSGSAISYTVPTQREAGIWTPPGPVADASGHIYVSVGNGAAGVGDSYDFSDSVLELDGSLNLLSSFAPTSWASENDSDLDLGSQGPALVGSYVFIAGKSGKAYVLTQGALGGIGGQVSSASVCTSFGGTAVRGGVVYVPCTDGVRAVKVNTSGQMHVLWHAASGTSGSPVYAGGRIWALDTGAGVLHALDKSSGSSVAAVSVGAVSRFATPAVYGSRLFVPTLSGLAVVTTS